MPYYTKKQNLNSPSSAAKPMKDAKQVSVPLGSAPAGLGSIPRYQNGTDDLPAQPSVLYPQKPFAPQDSNSSYGEQSPSLLGKVGSALSSGKGKAALSAFGNSGSDKPAELLPAPQLNQQELPDTIPSYQEGTEDTGDQPQLAVVDPHEQIIPASENPHNPERLISERAMPVEGLGRIAGAPPELKQIGPQQTDEDKSYRAATSPTAQVAPAKLAPAAPTGTGMMSQRTPQSVGLGQVSTPPPEAIAAGSETADKLTNPGQLQFQRNLINQDRMKAALAGPSGISALGMANIHEAELDKQNQWGGPSNHPGWLGKVGHIAAKVGNIAGDIAAPATMSLIPGTDLNRERQEQQGLGMVKQGTEENLQNAEAAKDREAARVSGLGKVLDPSEVAKQNETNARTQLGQINDLLQNPNLSPEDRSRLENMRQSIYSTQPTLVPPERQAKETAATTAQGTDYAQQVAALQLPEAAQKVYGTAPAGATPSQLKDRYAEAAALKTMGDKEAETAVSNRLHQDNADAAALQRQQIQTDKDQARNDKMVNYRDANGDLISGTRGDALAAGVKEKDIHGPTTPALQEKSRQAYTQYGRIISNAEEALRTLPAWNNETDRKAAMDVSKQFWDKMPQLAGLVTTEAWMGSPEFRQQIINSKAYERMTPEGRENMQNMFQIWSDAINIVKQETGGVPRGQVFLQKEDAILPHPDKTPDMNKKALLGLVSRIHTDSGEFARPSDMDALPKTIEHTQKIGGQEVTVHANGQFEYNGETYNLNPDGKTGTKVRRRIL